MKIDWDLTLREDLIIEWTALLSNLKQLKSVELPRFYFKDFSLDDINGIEMHGFSDASLKAYGCVIYLKFIFKDGNMVTTFLCSKTKIKPLEKSLTIPRLELLACTLLSSLIQTCVNTLSPLFNGIKIFCLSDSADCLYWINNTSKIWKQFIQSRVQKSRGNLPNIKWLHCPGRINPADIFSRGLSLSNDSTLKFWLNGPQFLLYTKVLWLSQDIISYDSINLIQEEKRVTENVIKLNEINCFSKFSSYYNLVRVLVYVKRFIFNCSIEGKNNKILDENVTLKQFSDAQIFLLFYKQQHFSSKEFIDKNGLIKIKGHFKNVPLNPPTSLNKVSNVTHLIIWNNHIRRLHSGVKDTLNHLRQQLWVSSGQQNVLNIVSHVLHEKFETIQTTIGTSFA